QWAREGQGGGGVLFGQHAYSNGRGLVSLEVTPPVGPPKTLWFDDVTGLLVRMTHHRDQYHWNETFSVWKKLAGRKRWTLSTVGDSVEFAAGFSRKDVDSVWIEAPPDPAAFSAPASTCPISRWRCWS